MIILRQTSPVIPQVPTKSIPIPTITGFLQAYFTEYDTFESDYGASYVDGMVTGLPNGRYKVFVNAYMIHNFNDLYNAYRAYPMSYLTSGELKDGEVQGIAQVPKMDSINQFEDDSYQYKYVHEYQFGHEFEISDTLSMNNTDINKFAIGAVWYGSAGSWNVAPGSMVTIERIGDVSPDQEFFRGQQFTRNYEFPSRGLVDIKITWSTIAQTDSYIHDNGRKIMFYTSNKIYSSGNYNIGDSTTVAITEFKGVLISSGGTFHNNGFVTTDNIYTSLTMEDSTVEFSNWIPLAEPGSGGYGNIRKKINRRATARRRRR